jgi:hypothetical protein
MAAVMSLEPISSLRKDDMSAIFNGTVINLYIVGLLDGLLPSIQANEYNNASWRIIRA